MSEYQYYEFAAVDGPISDEALRYAAEKRKQEEEARRQRLGFVMQRADAIWAGLDPLMDQKAAAAYDQVAAQLKELHDAQEQAGESARFQQKLSAFRQRYARRPALLRKIEKL